MVEYFNKLKNFKKGFPVQQCFEGEQSVVSGEGNDTPLQYSCLESHGRRSLVGCSPWGREELDTTERLHFHFSLSCIGEGHGNPLQCSCLEDPRDGGAWWAAIYGVAQSQTRLKRPSSGSSNLLYHDSQVIDELLKNTSNYHSLNQYLWGVYLGHLQQ